MTKIHRSINTRKAALWILLAAVVVSCTPHKQRSAGHSADGTATEESRANRPSSRTIASMAPSTTTILCALGLGPSIITADTWSAGTPGLPEEIPLFDMMKPDIELLASLESGIMFVSAMTKEGTSKDPFKPLSDAGTEVVYIPTSGSIAEIKNDIALIAEKTGVQDKGTQLVADMEKKIAEIRRTTANIPADQKKRVFFEISPAPYIYSFGSGVFLNELVEYAGLVNILAEETGWLSVSAETVAAADPDIIFTNVNYAGDPIPEILSRTGWEGVAAVRTGQVFYIDNNASSQPAHTVVKALEQMAKAAYPELF